MVVRPAMLLVLAALCGCASPRGPRPAVPAGRARVAILPFRSGGTLTADGQYEPGGRVIADADDVGAEFARLLARALAAKGVSVVDPDLVAGTAARADVGTYDAPTAAGVARRLNADLAVIGVVSRYRQRVGSAWGVQDPASVAYDAALVRATDAAVLRVDRFDYTQQALSENLLDLPRFIAGGGRWLTREEISEGALAHTAGRFAGLVHEGLAAR